MIDFVFVSTDAGQTWSAETMPPVNGTMVPSHMAIGVTGRTGTPSNPNVTGWVVGRAVYDYTDNVTVGVREDGVQPAWAGIQCVPEPFADRAMVYVTPRAGTTLAALRVTDVVGRTVLDLTEEARAARGSGMTAVMIDGTRLAPGAYVVTAIATDGSASSRTVIRQQ